MAGVRQHAWVFALVALSASVAALFLTVWRPHYRPSTQKPPAATLPYSNVQFTANDAKRAFAAVGIRLVPRSRVPGVVTTIGSRNDAFEVDVFGDPARVNALGGSPEIIVDSHGTYVRIPRTCTSGIPDAERWRGNVRFVIRCANPAHTQLLHTGVRALANL
ncbi:MAG TPA: hypothetical protein VNC40_06925 [Gaiellaceae bacterium]|nr:hypothetical protein [Gaiellaceae bacterium]